MKPSPFFKNSIFLLALTWLPHLVHAEKPVKVFILAGQSNMVGIGQVSGGSVAWGQEFSDMKVSTYPGKPDPSTDYDKLEPSHVMDLAEFRKTSFKDMPGEGVRVLRGQLQMPVTGIYEANAGYGDSTYSIMVVDGKEIFRRELGKEAVVTPVTLEAGKTVPFKITYLKKDGVPVGWWTRTDVPGTLKTVVQKEGKFPYLLDGSGQFRSRDDVWYKGVVTATANKWLSIGCGASDSSIGPELGFGHKMGDLHEEPVLILKASQGNRSLGWDFLPPGSERFEFTDEEGVTWVHAGYKDTCDRWQKGSEPTPVPWYAGKQYDDCFGAAKEVLANFDANFPHWKGCGYEIAGFGWWQGHKDGGEQGKGKAGALATRYEHNLVTLIQTLRKEFNAPKAPFVVASCGFGGGKDWEPGSSADTIFHAQMHVGDPAKHPEFAGNVKSVDTRSFYRAPEISPRDQGFHYNGNAETYMLVGESMGEAMAELLGGKK